MKHSRDQQHAITPETVLAALQRRLGKANGVTATQLVIELAEGASAADERRLRDCVVFLRTQGHPVCALPAHGYFIAANEDELNESCHHLLERAKTSLQQAYAQKRVAMPDLAGQLGLPVTTQQGESSP
jgi:hypothetical protein